ncbi:heparan-alpha-glucosaminide N-acetyltransferase [Microvirga rosea]|uniref:heparan-alpha-glucosaminide N-acetyltransferase n=1 Tax=Microvirga rosea TaxID=2715425 RepID=UPI001D09D8B3|nr:heparan-alpha-glucosaminide N-acetyltransferase [Microvirga rosea]MCB8820852.1 DUF1624 domain-containing protein [Microvirga rosea]
MTTFSPPAATVAKQRWDILDVARGLAILAMVVYHFSWDLSFLKLIAADIVAIPAWRWFARCIAGSFLFLSGIGLVLAHAQGMRWRAFLRRLAKVGGAAVLITVATYFAFPDSFIFFGILHCIAVSGVLALPFLRLPPLLVLLFAAFCLAAPWLFTSPALDQPWLDWLGLGSTDPVTNDYVPIFPWFGLVLAGVAAGKALTSRPEILRLAQWRARDRLSGGLKWAGRKSLPIYLIHQVVLLGLLYGVLQVTGPSPMAEARPFVAECEASCLSQNGQPGTCKALCSCVANELRHSDLWSKVLGENVGPDDQTRISRTAQQCLRQTEPR